MANIFRKASLDRLSSPEQLDRLITVTSPRIWLMMIAIGLVLTCAVIWGIFGSIPLKVDTSGILISSGGTTTVSSTVNGQITDVRVEVGDEIRKGDVIAIIGENEIVAQINKNEEIIKILSRLSIDSDWGKLTVPTELLELQQLGLQYQSQTQAASAAATEPNLAKEEYEAYQKLFEGGAVSKAEMDDKYKTYRNAQRNYQQQTLTASQSVAQFNSTKKAKLEELNTMTEDLRESLESQYQIIAPNDGKVTAVEVKKGAVVAQGAIIAGLAVTGSNVKALEGVIYVPVSDGKKLKEGMDVKLYPSTVQKEEYGYMHGTVVTVPEYPVNTQSVMTTLGNEALVQELTGQGAPLEVRVDLVADKNTVSGYAWSSKKGAEVGIENGTLCAASIVVAEQSPISMVIPLLKKKFLPFE